LVGARRRAIAAFRRGTLVARAATARWLRRARRGLALAAIEGAAVGAELAVVGVVGRARTGAEEQVVLLIVVDEVARRVAGALARGGAEEVAAVVRDRRRVVVMAASVE
jgi:glutamyl-tRNA reductase